MSLQKPDHLRPGDEESLFASRKIAAGAALIGAISFCVVAVLHHQLASSPDWKITVPGFAATVIVSILSISKREPGGFWVWGIGILFAVASMLIGWFLILAIVIVATVVVILILHAIM